MLSPSGVRAGKGAAIDIVSLCVILREMQPDC